MKINHAFVLQPVGMGRRVAAKPETVASKGIGHPGTVSPGKSFSVPMMFGATNLVSLPKGKNAGPVLPKFAGFGKNPLLEEVDRGSIPETRTPEFRAKFQAVLDDAKAHIAGQVKQGNNGIVILDLDETLLDNREYYEKQSFSEETFKEWAEQGAPAISETLEFVRWLEQEGIEYRFITGRGEELRDATEANLKKIGVSQHTGLYLKTEAFKDMTSSDYKTLTRCRIEHETGRKIVASVGDQDSDMAGPCVGKGFKLPNPIYIIH